MKKLLQSVTGFVVLLLLSSVLCTSARPLDSFDGSEHLPQVAMKFYGDRVTLSQTSGDDPFESGNQSYGQDFVVYGNNDKGQKYLLSEEEYFGPSSIEVPGIKPLSDDSHESNDSFNDATNLTPFNGKSFLTYQEIQISATLTNKSSWFIHRLDEDFYMFFLHGPGRIQARLETEAHLSYKVEIYEYDTCQPYKKPADAIIKSAKFTNSARRSVVISSEADSARTMYVRVVSHNDSVDGDSPYLLTVELKTDTAWFSKGQGVSLSSLKSRSGAIGALWVENFQPEGVSPTPFGSQMTGSSSLLNMYDPLLGEVRNVSSGDRVCTAVFYLWDQEVKLLLRRYVQWAYESYKTYVEGKYSKNSAISIIESVSGIGMYVAGALVSSSSFSYLLNGLSLASDMVGLVVSLTTSHSWIPAALDLSYYLGTLNGALGESGHRTLIIPFFYRIIGSTLEWPFDSYSANAVSFVAEGSESSAIIPYIRPDSCFEGKVASVTSLSDLNAIASDRTR